MNRITDLEEKLDIIEKKLKVETDLIERVVLLLQIRTLENKLVLEGVNYGNFKEN